MNRFNTAVGRYTVSAWRLIFTFLRHPFYDVLLCANSFIGPSPWTECFEVEIDHKHKVIRLSGDFD